MITFHDTDNGKIAEVTDVEFQISTVQDAVDLLGDMYYNNCNAIILKEINLHPDFFKLHTGLAGDILQKVSNYQFKLAVTGDFSKYTSKSLQDFIRESNRGNRVFFVENTDEALLRFGKK
ncbi:MAG: DUF4180 domain-containing protein [Bacteroidales bacterium]|nr:DUF4180 domain-containing protein [Bacteroidales bacterium]MBK7625785.1 DUF4180 domain-containing protein [Bacteroidales bacterium]